MPIAMPDKKDNSRAVIISAIAVMSVILLGAIIVLTMLFSGGGSEPQPVDQPKPAPVFTNVFLWVVSPPSV
jgi:flagellar basal body-associated protein FliL